MKARQMRTPMAVRMPVGRQLPNEKPTPFDVPSLSGCTTVVLAAAALFAVVWAFLFVLAAAAPAYGG